MTQSPFGGNASPSTPGAPSTQRSGQQHPAAGNEFGATTISGSPMNATATQERSSGVQHTGPNQRAGQSGQPGQPNLPGQPASPGRASRGRGPRRARLQLRHISPLTVLKFSCVLAIALFFVWLIIVGVLYGVLDAAGAIGHVNNAYSQLNGPGTKAPITSGIVFGGAAIVGVVNIILFVALTTIGSVIYNLCADLVGGIEITLSER